MSFAVSPSVLGHRAGRRSHGLNLPRCEPTAGHPLAFSRRWCLPGASS